MILGHHSPKTILWCCKFDLSTVPEKLISGIILTNMLQNMMNKINSSLSLYGCCCHLRGVWWTQVIKDVKF